MKINRVSLALLLIANSFLLAETHNVSHNHEQTETQQHEGAHKNYVESFKDGYLAGLYAPLLPITFIKPLFNTIFYPEWDKEKPITKNVQEQKKILKRSYIICGTGVLAGWATLTLGAFVMYRLAKKCF